MIHRPRTYFIFINIIDPSLTAISGGDSFPIFDEEGIFEAWNDKRGKRSHDRIQDNRTKLHGVGSFVAVPLSRRHREWIVDSFDNKFRIAPSSQPFFAAFNKVRWLVMLVRLFSRCRYDILKFTSPGVLTVSLRGFILSRPKFAAIMLYLCTSEYLFSSPEVDQRLSQDFRLYVILLIII